MGFKNFLVSIIKSLIVLVTATLIFSTISLDSTGLVEMVFGDIFAHASLDEQKQVTGNLAQTCSSLGNEQSDSFALNLSRIGELCNDYKTGNINDQEFFFNVIGNAFSLQQTQMPSLGALDKYNKAIGYLNSNKPVYFLILAVLIITLYLLIGDLRLFIMALAGISLSIGIFIMLPYLAVLAYENLVGFDTTPILSGLVGAGNVFDLKAITSVVLLLFLRTYSSFIITAGIIFLGVGIAGKVYSRLTKDGKTKEAETYKKPEKEEPKKAKAAKNDNEDADESYNHRDRTAKEILDELEEMHRKKMKERED